MKNVTIKLEEKTAAWARQQSARRSVSLSRFIGELLEKSMLESQEYDGALREYFARKPAPLTHAPTGYPSRDKLHGRGRLS